MTLSMAHNIKAHMAEIMQTVGTVSTRIQLAINNPQFNPRRPTLCPKVNP
jgi:hypothetical protein